MIRCGRFHVRVALAFGLTWLAAGPVAAAQDWVPGKRMSESISRVMGGVRTISDKTRYGYTNDVCLLAAFLTTGEKVTFTRHFDTGVKYAVVGGGDDTVKDLDVEILDANDRVIASDTKDDATPVTEFTVPRPGKYVIRMTMHAASAKAGGFGTLAVLRDGGYDVPVRNLGVAVGNLVKECNRVNGQTSKDVYFSSGNNQWAVFGTILEQEASLTFSNVRPGGGTRVMVTGADTTADDIDLYLLDADGEVTAKDEDADPRPQIVYQAKHGRPYGFRVKNVKSRSPSLVLTATLAIKD